MKTSFGTLVFALYFNSGISNEEIKYRFFLNHLPQRKQEHGGWKEPQAKDKFL